MLFQKEEKQKKYPVLHQYTSFVKQAEREIVGRKSEMRSLLAGMQRPELCNALLLGEAGAGKTALVQGVMMRDKDRLYLEVNLSNMISTEGKDALPGMLESLFAEVQLYREEEDREIVLFIDEFHRIVQESAPAVEALKPLLADSGTRGIKIIAATTYTEFRKFIAPNQPLVERLQRINITQPDKATTIEILKGMAKRYGVANQIYGDFIYEQIYEYTERYIPANSQPRKSILVLDNMVGWHRSEGRMLDKSLLADVIYEQEGINVSFRVDATKIKKELDKRVLAQGFATAAVEQRLQICVADLHNKTKPMSSLLFTGSTGTGKALDDNVMVPIWTQDGSVSFKRHGDLKVGDYVFNREGKPVLVTGVFPRGEKTVYEVELADGRILRTCGQHLWTYKVCYDGDAKSWKIADTEFLMKKYLSSDSNTGEDISDIKFVIPMNQPVEWIERKYQTDPYVMGVAIGNGRLRSDSFEVSLGDVDTILLCQHLLGASDIYADDLNDFYGFYKKSSDECKCDVKCKYVTSEVLSEVPVLIGCKPEDTFIPDIYKHGSVNQRWALIQGLFDTNGAIGDKFQVSYFTISERLAYDVQDVLYSLGISSCVINSSCVGTSTEYQVHVKCNASDKLKFFRLEHKLERAKQAAAFSSNESHTETFGEVIGIRDIRKLDEKVPMTCIMVDDDEHLYQAGPYIVTHNTELTKGLADILFNDPFRLIRFDCTEYANPSSLERFRRELTAKVWAMPYCIVLLDEIEKACAEVTRVLLQVLDDGRLMDENNREVVFTNCYIILTTNAGSEVYRNISQYNASDTGVGDWVKRYDKLIRDSISRTTGDNRFPPELLGRIDMIVPFQPLSETTMKKITEMKLLKLKADVRKKHNIDLKINSDVIRYLVEDNLDTRSDSGGARVVVSKLESEVVSAVAKFINAHPDISSMGVTVDGQLAADNKQMLESNARIKVVPL